MMTMKVWAKQYTVKDLLHERCANISHETIRYWWNRFSSLFAAETRKKRAANHEGEVLESFVTKRRNRRAALRFLRKAMKRYG